MSSLVASYNRAIWPLQIVACGTTLALLWVAVGGRARGSAASRGGATSRLPGLVLAAAWAWTGAVFYGRYLAAIDFMAPVYAALFLLQALFVAWSGVVRGRLALRPPLDRIGWLGAALVIWAIAGDPVIAWVAGEGAAGVRVVGLAPGPTVVLTFGLLVLADGRTPLYLVALPLLWSLVAGAAAWVLRQPEDLVLPLLGLGSLALIVIKNRRSPAT